jgi:hypothetical protein
MKYLNNSLDNSPFIMDNEHVLNFHEGVECLPEWLTKDGLSLIMGAGDLDQEGILNVKKFSDFDVFFCNNWSYNGTIERNIAYLAEHYFHQKVICIIDVHNEQEMLSFTELFKHRFRRVDGYGQHTPHMSIADLERVLCLGAKATNIYEMSEMCMELDEFKKYLKDDYYPYIVLMDGKVYRNPCTQFNLGEENTAELKALVLRRIRDRVDKQGFIKVEESALQDIESYSLWHLQKILKALLYETQFPPNMAGIVGWNKRSWSEESMLELVVQRIEPNYYLERFYDEEQKGKMSALVDAIKADISMGFIFGARMKYKRLMRVLKALQV